MANKNIFFYDELTSTLRLTKDCRVCVENIANRIVKPGQMLSPFWIILPFEKHSKDHSMGK